MARGAPRGLEALAALPGELRAGVRAAALGAATRALRGSRMDAGKQNGHVEGFLAELLSALPDAAKLRLRDCEVKKMCCSCSQIRY